ncbi:ATP cone domain-containing protein, partial [Clostridium botulinum]
MSENIKVIKRDGRVKYFDRNRIKIAIQRAADEVCINKNIVDDKSNNHLWLDVLVDKIQDRIKTSYTHSIHIEEIQDIIIDELYNADKLIAKAYKD